MVARGRGLGVSLVALVGFVGSRCLVAPGVVPVVRSVLASGRGVAVGCASGVDASALSVALAVAPARVSVFAVGGASGRGFWSGRLPALVARAVSAGASVAWWAGGSVAPSVGRPGRRGRCLRGGRGRRRVRLGRAVRLPRLVGVGPPGGRRGAPGRRLSGWLFGFGLSSVRFGGVAARRVLGRLGRWFSLGARGAPLGP